MSAKSHKDVEFSVSTEDVNDPYKYFKNFDNAAAFAVQRAISTGESTLDVVVSSESGARWLGGDDVAEQYNEDPEASVFERLEIKVNSLGRVP